MKRGLGIARCGLACCLCSENESCPGCAARGRHGDEWCENEKCSRQRNLEGCYACTEECEKGLLGKTKPQAFTLFARRYGKEALLDCLEENEKRGIVYHREGIIGDYDAFEDVEGLIRFIRTGIR